MLVSFSSFGQNEGLYKVVYEADREGNTLSGSLEELLAYVRNGNPIRVGWELGKKEAGLGYLEHWTDAGFITIQKEHVFAQISSIYAQASSAPQMTEAAMFLTDDKPDGWVAIIGTTGEVKQKFRTSPQTLEAYKQMGLSDEEIQKQLKNQETMRVKTKWAVMIKD